MLKAGIAFLAWLLFSAVLVEAGNGKPRPVCRRLAGLRVEPSGKEIRFRQLGRVVLQLIVPNAASIHPEPHTLVANELHGPNSFVNRVL
jgi:hypothetical protein